MNSTEVEERREALRLLLALTSDPLDLRGSLQRALGLLHEWSGCDSVAVRLQQNGDYPYYLTSGFSPAFVDRENSLCAADSRGRPQLGPDGRPVLECACGAVIQGRLEGYQPNVTPGGSFWTNHASALAAEMDAGGGRPASGRGACLAAGYETIALVPLRSGNQTLGLMQLNDHRPNRLSPEGIELLEGLARGLAQLVALHRQRECLAQGQALLDLALDGLEDPVILLRPDYSVVRLNLAGWRLYGRRPRPLEGDKCYELLGRETPCEDCIIQECRRSRAPVTRERTFPGAQGQYLCRSYPVTDSAGRVNLVLEHITDVTERRQEQQAARRELEHKDVLLREIHHRVKNNLQVLHSLLSLQARLCPEPAAAKALDDSQGRVKAMALVHQLLQHSEDLERVDLAVYLRRLAEAKLQAWLPSSQGVSLALELEPAPAPVDRAMHCGLAVNELIANALEHAFGQGGSGSLRVSLEREEPGAARVEVADDGPGLPEGLEPGATGTLGLQLVQGLAEAQLQGRLLVHSRPGDTCFTLRFALERPS